MKKLPVLCFVLAGFAVRCEDAYYIVRMGGERRGKLFEVYWNVPTMQCRSKGIPFDELDAFGIIQNEGDSFRGNKIAILYDPGLFPALLKNETSGKFKFRNGGVPQEGNLTLHLDVFRETVVQSIPDQNFDGIAVIDFESWRPILRQNFGELVPYKDISYEIERKKHRWWLETWIREEAKSRFEEAGRTFMQNTISVAKQLRPRAVWGYYGFPYCFNIGVDGKEDCTSVTKGENDRLYWLWSESPALYPSLYSSKSLTTSQLTSLVRGRIREAARHVRKHSRVLPYVWYRHRDGGLLGQDDLTALLETIHKSEATGFIIWGSSSDVNTVAKCRKLHRYIYNVFGPAIANYTKHSLKDDRYTLDLNAEDNDITNENNLPETDPESSWIPPVNYTQDIKKYVEDEYKNEKPDNMTEIAQEVSLIELISKVYEEKLNHSIPITTVNINSTNLKEIEQIVNASIEGTIVKTTVLNKDNDITVSTTTETQDKMIPSESVINETVLIEKPVSTTETNLPELISTTTEETTTIRSNDQSTMHYDVDTTTSSTDASTETSENYDISTTVSTAVTEMTTIISSTTVEYGTETSTYSFEEFNKEFGEDIRDITTNTEETNVDYSATEATETTTVNNDLQKTTANTVKDDQNADNDNEINESSTRLPKTDKYPVIHIELPHSNSSTNQVVIYEVIQD